MTEAQTLNIAAEVALRELTAKATADDAYWRNRVLVLAQQLADSQAAHQAENQRADALQAIIADKLPELEDHLAGARKLVLTPDQADGGED